MFKWVSWVIRMGATALLLSFLCIWTTGYIVNSYMETIVKQLNLPVEIKPIALSGIWGTLWGAGGSPSKTAEIDKDDKDGKDEKTDEASSTPSSSPKPSSEASPSPSSHPSESVGGEDGDDDTPASDQPSDEPSNPADASADPDAVPGEDGTVPVMGSAGESAGTGTQLTDEQRQSLYALVVSKLNPSQLQQLSDALKGGQTPEQMKAVQEMLKSALTNDEFVQMMGILQGPEKPDTSGNEEQ
ncbi:hypothetical protein ACFPPD_11710 [Cohnella suwonensis]|uniref:Spore coat protein n=1 Tax=Cohnella suwonensis TaxID=696072 RepID=A0ABW0LXQ5_9BACL